MIDFGWKTRTFFTFIMMQSLGKFRVPYNVSDLLYDGVDVARDGGWGGGGVRSENHCVDYRVQRCEVTLSTLKFVTTFNITVHL